VEDEQVGQMRYLRGNRHHDTCDSCGRPLAPGTALTGNFVGEDGNPLRLCPTCLTVRSKGHEPLEPDELDIDIER
jgi:hypothetical protein